MSEFILNTPVVMVIFRRPDTTRMIFEKVRQVKPKQLFVIADGPNKNRVAEFEKCEQCRAIFDEVDWDCEVKKFYSDVNLTTDVIVPNGLDWVFDQVETAIVLEDDCLPDVSFFRFCQELLVKYKNDTRIMLISGDNFQPSEFSLKESYYFSHYPYIWGWATWKRVWKDCFESKSQYISDVVDSEVLTRNFLPEIVPALKASLEVDGQRHWDTAMLFCLLRNNGMSISPAVNLISNIGFRDDAVNTVCSDSALANVPLKEMKFPLIHPKNFIYNYSADDFLGNIIYRRKSFFVRAFLFCRQYGIKKFMMKILKRIGKSCFL